MLGQEQLTQKGLTQRWLTQKRVKLFVPKLLFQGSTGWWRADNVEKDLSDAVSILYDNSRNGFHMIQNTQVSKPILVENQINGNSALRFDGVNDFMRVNFGQTFAQPNTYFIVWNVTDYTGNSHYAFTGLDLNNRNAFIFVDATKNMSLGSPSFIFYYQKQESTFPFILNSCIFNSTQSQLFENTLNKGTGNTGNASMTGLTIGGSTHTPVRNPLNGHICEIIFFNRILTQSETQLVNNYISQKYGLF